MQWNSRNRCRGGKTIEITKKDSVFRIESNGNLGRPHKTLFFLSLFFVLLFFSFEESADRLFPTFFSLSSPPFGFVYADIFIIQAIRIGRVWNIKMFIGNRISWSIFASFHWKERPAFTWSGRDRKREMAQNPKTLSFSFDWTDSDPLEIKKTKRPRSMKATLRPALSVWNTTTGTILTWKTRFQLRID